MLVVNGKLAPDYVLDDISNFEIEAILNQINFNFKNEWEQTRQLYYIIAQVNSTSKLKPTDIMPFDWDEKTESIVYTDEEKNKIKNNLLEIAKKSTCK